RVDKREDRRVRADAERQREDGDGGEPRTAAERTQRVACVLHHDAERPHGVLLVELGSFPLDGRTAQAVSQYAERILKRGRRSRKLRRCGGSAIAYTRRPCTLRRSTTRFSRPISSSCSVSGSI